MAVRKIKGSWWVDFMYNFERMRKRSPLNTRGGAAAFEVQLRQLVAQRGSVANALEAMEPKRVEKPLTFAEFSARWLRDYAAVNNKPSEQRNKRQTLRGYLLPAFGAIALADITSLHVEQLKGSMLASGLCAKTTNNHLTILHTCLATAVEWGELAVVPRVRQLKSLPPPFRFLNALEVETLLAHAPDAHWHLMILVAVRTGLRFGELAALRWRDIDLANAMLTVSRSRYMHTEATPKNGRARHIPLTPDVLALLRPLRGTPDAFVLSCDGPPAEWMRATRTLHRTCQAAGIAPIGWHALRHTFASHLAQRGVPLHVIKELLGHATIQMTLRYAHLAPNNLRDAVAVLVAPVAGQFMAAHCQPEPVSTPTSVPSQLAAAPILG